MLACHFYRISLLSLVLFMLTIDSVNAEQLDDFSSDGCSQFPDGTLGQQDLWCDCCITHDIAYWQGGTQAQKQQADIELRACVLHKTESSLLASTMYYGVTWGGSPIFPVWYRWGYGWQYGRGFLSLSADEKALVEVKLQQYYLTLPGSSCDFEHPIKKMIRKEVQTLLR